MVVFLRAYGDIILRGDRHRLKGVAECEGIVRYRHQGGGQRNARQTGGIYDV